MGRKIALLIGVGDYGNGLKPLRCPANGVEAVKTVLQDANIGGFEQVIPLINPDVVEMRRQISEVFAPLSKDDLLLFYFTGHGIKDQTGAFYLGASQTYLYENGRLNSGTAVEAEFVKREIQTDGGGCT